MSGPALPWIYDDGGRAEAGRKGSAADCVCRAVAIATGTPYATVYEALNREALRERPRAGRRSNARTGIAKPTIRRYLAGLGWVWVPTMAIGSGCTVHLRADELPAGRLIVAVSRHLVAVIYGVAHDTHDPSRDGSRCVYGYYMPTRAEAARLAEANLRAEAARLAEANLRAEAARRAAVELYEQLKDKPGPA